MTDTPHLMLPLLSPSQAQKHVTVNEALVRLDGLVQLRLASVSQSSPPGVVIGGVAYGIPVGAVDAWAGKDGLIALAMNGGWSYITPQEGWKAWVIDRNSEARWINGDWQAGLYIGSQSAGASRIVVQEFDHVITSGASNLTASVIPANAMVFAVSARVIDTLTGSLSGWKLGAGASDDRFGSGMGPQAGSYCHGIQGSPVTFYSDAPIEIGAIGGVFTGGTLRIVMHYYAIDLPQV